MAKTIQNFVGAILVDLESKLLLVKEDDTNKIANNRWNLPGGRVEKGESLEQAIEREVEEETGYKSEVNELLAVYLVNKSDVEWLYFVYKVTAINWNKVEASDQDVKLVHWFTEKEITNLDESELVHPDMKVLYRQVLSKQSPSLQSSKKISY